jgi:hypothetical protein
MSDIELLHREFNTHRPLLEAVMKAYFPHISSKKYFLQEVKAQRITLRVSKDAGNHKAKHFVHLADLAAWLAAQNPSTTNPAAHQAAA